MSERVSWKQAEGVAKSLSADEVWILKMILKLPLAPVALLVSVHGQACQSILYELVARLEESGLLGSVRPAIKLGLSPRLLYLTDLGLAALALLHGTDVGTLAQEHKVRRSDLLRLLPRAGTLVATYELLGAIARSCSGLPTLHAWERPWVMGYQSPTARALVRVTLPGYVEVAWREEGHESEGVESYLLVPDRARFPVRHFRRAIDQLFVLRATRYPDIQAFPSLLVAVPNAGRAHDWRELLEEVRRGRAEAPLRARVATWRAL